IRDSLNILLEGLPKGLNLKNVSGELSHVPGVIVISFLSFSGPGFDSQSWVICAHFNKMASVSSARFLCADGVPHVGGSRRLRPTGQSPRARFGRRRVWV